MPPISIAFSDFWRFDKPHTLPTVPVDLRFPDMVVNNDITNSEYLVDGRREVGVRTDRIEVFCSCEPATCFFFEKADPVYG